MRVVRSVEGASALPPRPAVTTLGTFDGVHLGHQAVIHRVVEEARTRDARAVVVTFGRHPRAVIKGEAPKLLTPLRQRLQLFKDLEVDLTVLLHFDGRLRMTPARTFVKDVLVEGLRSVKVVLGYNNRFGRGGEGDFRLLEQMGREVGFEAEQVPGVVLEGQPISSTAIRHAVLEGDLQGAGRMLGRPFSVLGTVVHGDHRGSRLGFPTANLNVHHAVRPPRGVYGVEVLLDGRRLHGLVNIGLRPTVHDRPTGEAGPGPWEERDRLETVEVHVLDFEGDLYGRQVEIRFLVRLREERRFDSLEALRNQIAADCLAFRSWLADRSSR